MILISILYESNLLDSIKKLCFTLHLKNIKTIKWEKELYRIPPFLNFEFLGSELALYAKTYK